MSVAVRAISVAAADRKQRYACGCGCREQEHTTAMVLAHAEAILTTRRHPFLVLDADVRVKSANANFYKAFQVDERATVGRLNQSTFKDYEVEPEFEVWAAARCCSMQRG